MSEARKHYWVLTVQRTVSTRVKGTEKEADFCQVLSRFVVEKMAAGWEFGGAVLVTEAVR